MSAVSVTPRLLAEVNALLFVVAGADKEHSVQALEAGDPNLTAWLAVKECAAVALWICLD
jgi:6-phosphogluconolactonase/glucosamine-6-phosphate isomerase/deaminase